MQFKRKKRKKLICHKFNNKNILRKPSAHFKQQLKIHITYNIFIIKNMFWQVERISLKLDLLMKIEDFHTVP